METRFLINEFAIKQKIPWIYAGVHGTVGMIMAVIPKITPCFKCISENIINKKLSYDAANASLIFRYILLGGGGSVFGHLGKPCLRTQTWTVSKIKKLIKRPKLEPYPTRTSNFFNQHISILQTMELSEPELFIIYSIKSLEFKFKSTPGNLSPKGLCSDGSIILQTSLYLSSALKFEVKFQLK